ncbi:1,4-alpha-glucan branching enzyme [Burkholderiaceae bacterium DAT-1]|nr:1,4-alpha-glucan branching enzyme [Burkholderiaceae bacterium DAT-1]
MGHMEAIAEGLDAWSIESICRGEHPDPFSVLGPHHDGKRLWIRVWQPGALQVNAIDSVGHVLSELSQLDPRGLFAGVLSTDDTRPAYRLSVLREQGTQELEDPYRFAPLLQQDDLAAWSAGQHAKPWEIFGAQLCDVAGTSGCLFSVWAPNARRVAVTGDFNRWDTSLHAMYLHRDAGIWEIFVPGVQAGMHYRFDIMNWQGRHEQHNDPFALEVSDSPQFLSVVTRHVPRTAARALMPAGAESAVSIYELDLAAWQTAFGPTQGNWTTLAANVLPCVQSLGFTHICLLPLSSHVLEGIQGLRSVDRFAPAPRFGTPEGLHHFVAEAHRAGIGVIMDWSATLFPSDQHGLGHFDGTHLFEHPCPHEDFVHAAPRFNYGRPEVSNYLMASALYWLEHYDLDGLRLHGLSAILYNDDARPAGEWIPHGHSGLENLDAIHFLQSLNRRIAACKPTAIVIAEEDTAFAGITRSAEFGGLGFHYKANDVWLNDTLTYLRRQPSHRRFHHHEITFGPSAAHAERHLLSLSYRQLGKELGALYSKMPGDGEIRFANLRTFLAFMWCHPGKKSLFMGSEFATPAPWLPEKPFDRSHEQAPGHRGIRALVACLNRCYRDHAALHELDCSAGGFEWISQDDADHATLAFVRHSHTGESVLVICNFSQDRHPEYRVGLPRPGTWQRILHTEDAAFEGSGQVGPDALQSEDMAMHGKPVSACLPMAPLSVCAFQFCASDAG